MSHEFKTARDFLLRTRTDYETAYKEFRWPRVERFNWALDWFDEIARGARADQPAIQVVEEDGQESKLSFRQLSSRSSQVANHWRGLGVRRGDRVLVMMGNIPPLWEAMLAAMKLGAVIVPTTPLLTSDDIADRIARGKVKCVVAASVLAPKFDGVNMPGLRIAVGSPVAGWHSYEQGYSASPRFEPDGPTLAADPLQLYFTSGTTMKPKLVMHTHASYPVGHLSTMYWLGLRPGDVHFNLSSPGWAKHAWSCFFAPWNAEATVFVLNQSRFRAHTFLDALVRCRVTSCCAPPTVWRMLIKEKLENWTVPLREAASAGEPLNPEVIERVRQAWGITIRDGYGQTETSALVGNPPGQELKAGSMGRPLPGYRILLLDGEGHQSGEAEICVSLDPRPAGVMPGYLSDSGEILPIQATAYHTGDIASRDRDGYLTFIGRTDDVFKSSDYRISPFELESALIRHPDVMECAVVPSPDPDRLCVPKAFILLRAGINPSRDTALSIFRHARRVLASYKRVRRIEFVDLPKTVSGKIRRFELRRMEDARPGSAPQRETEFCEEGFPELR
ncbi:MAG TPA: AMP-binding protein [Patescibacteria group bacterium]|nr:AMP-binding protein [Patescibacteria group bacterium]